MAISDQDIFNWFVANQGADDATIASTMDQFKLTPQDIARATGTNVADVAARYEATKPAATNGALTQATNDVAQTSANTGALDQVVNNAGNVLSGNILAGASWNSTNNTLADQLTATTGLPTINTAVGGATTADTLQQLNNFKAAGGTFAPGSTVFLQTGGVDMLQGVDDATITKNINQIVSTLGADGVKVVLTTSPRAGSLTDVVNNNFETGPASFYSDIAANNANVVTVDTMGQILQDKSLLRDALHTNAAGEQVYNASVIAAYERLNPAQKIEVSNKVQASGASAPADLAEAIDEVAGTNVATTAAQAAKAANTIAVELQGKSYTVNADDVNKVKAQILAQGTTSKWTGEGFGSAEANAEAMAKQLVANGVTDINQVGMVEKKVDEAVTPVYQQGEWIDNGEGGGYFTQKLVGYKDSKGNTVDPNLVKSEYVSEGEGGGIVYLAPVGTQKVIGNTVTGQGLINDYGERGGVGDAWSGTYAGKGNTAFRTAFTADGKPIFYTTGASSNTLVNMFADDPILGKVATAAAAYFGGPAGVAALQAAMGKSVEDIAKSALLTYAGGEIAGQISGSTDLVNSIGADATKALAKGAGQLVSSGGKADIGNLLISGGIDAGVDAITSKIDGFSNLSAGEQNFVKTVAKTTIQNGGDLSIGDLVDAGLTAATTAAKAAKSGTISTAIAADQKVNDAVTAEIDKQTTIDASGARDVNDAAAFAESQGYTKFTFDGKTYNVGNNNAANTVAQLEADALAANTAANLKGGEFDGVDQAVRDIAAKNTVAIGNAEADTPEEAAALAKSKGFSTFTFDGKTYNMNASTAEVNAALAQTKIADAKTFDEAYKAARDGLGAGKVFTWNGKQYTTDTREENPALAAASDITRLNNIAASTESGGGRGSAASYATYDAKAAADALSKTKVIPDFSAGDAYGFNETVYDPATGVALLNSKATADPNTALGKAVIAANNAVGSVVQTGLSNLANAGGEQLAAFGGVLATIGATDANNMLVQAGKAAQQVGSAIETAESKQGTANIINAVSKADGMGGKLIAGLKAGWENPVAALNLITREGLQEILPAGVALKASKIMSLAAAAGIDTALNAGESMGQAYNDAYSAAIAKGMSKENADALATQVGLSAGAITLVTSGVMDAALIKTVFREGMGTVSSQLAKGATKEGISENIEETATALATQYLTTGKIDLGDAMTQGALGHLIGKTTAGSVGAVDVAAQTETINNNITAAVTSGDAASVNTAITNSVQQSLSSGASVELSVGASVNSAITNGADAGSSITSAVTSAVASGADVSQTVTASIDSAITAGADTSVAINSTVTSAITSGASVSQTVSGSITAATTAGVSANTAITNTVNSAVTASITSGADVATSVNSAVNSAITSAVTSNANITTAVDSSVSSAINAAVTSNANVTTAVNSAVTTAITTAISSNVNANTAVTTAVNSAVTTAINSNVNANTAITTSVTAAINAAVNANTNTNTNTNTNVNSNVNTNVNSNVNTNVTTAVNTAVTAAVNAAVTTGVDVNTAVNAAVNAAISTNVNIDLKDLTKIATDAATVATEKVDLITSVTDLISGTPSTPSTPTTPTTPTTKTPSKAPAALTAGLIGGSVMAGELGRLPPQMLKAYMTQDKFVDPLAQLHALQDGMNTEKMESLPQVNTQEPAMPDQGTWKYGNAPDDIDTLFAEEEAPAFKAGGYVAPLQMASGGAMPLPLLVKSGGALGALPRPDGRMDFRHGAHVAGEGDGQSDDIKAMLADGEFVFPADVVSALGNGSTKAGSDKLYEMMHAIRERARSKKPKDLPPPALKSPLDYLKKR